VKWGLYDARFGAAVRTRLSFAKRDNVELFSVLNFAITFYFGCKGTKKNWKEQIELHKV
jgi:hypothetical protein